MISKGIFTSGILGEHFDLRLLLCGGMATTALSTFMYGFGI
jgi:hypothetical protein